MTAILLTAASGMLVDTPAVGLAQIKGSSGCGVDEPYDACSGHPCSSKSRSDSPDAPKVPPDEPTRGFSRALQEKVTRHSDCKETSDSNESLLNPEKTSSGASAEFKNPSADKQDQKSEACPLDKLGAGSERSQRDRASDACPLSSEVLVSGKEQAILTVLPGTPEGEAIDHPDAGQGSPRILYQAGKQAFPEDLPAAAGEPESKAALQNGSGWGAGADGEVPEAKRGTVAVQPDGKTLAQQAYFHTQVNEASADGNRICEFDAKQTSATTITPHALKPYQSLPTETGESPNTDKASILGPKKSGLLAQESTDNELASSRTLLEPRGDKGVNGGLTDDAIAWKLNAEALRVSLNQTKGCQIPAPNDGSTADLACRQTAFEQPVSSDGRFSASIQVSNSTEAAKTAADAWASDLSPSISQQITESVHGALRQGDKQVTIYLNPPDLGKILVRFEEQEEKITGLLEVSKAEIRSEIEQALPQIIRNLTDCGVQLKRMEVLLTDQPEEEAAKGQLPQDSSFQRQSLPQDSRGFAEAGDPGSKSTLEWQASGLANFNADSPGQQAVAMGNSINILL
jgi:flagellar hook-length control protein FliK